MRQLSTLIILIVFICKTSHLLANHAPVKHKTDSLISVLSTIEKNDEGKAQLYLELFWVNRNYSLSQAELFLQKAEMHLKKSSNYLLQSKYLHYSAVHSFNLKKYKEFRVLMDSSIVIIERLDQPKLLFETLKDFANNEFKITKSQRSVLPYEQILSLAEKHSNTDWLAKGYLVKSQHYMLIRQIEKGFALLKLADSLYQITGNKHGLLETEYRWAAALLKKGKYKETLELAIQGELKAKELGCEEVEMKFIALQARYPNHFGDYPRAIPLYVKLYNYYKKSQQRFNQVKWLNRISYAQRMIGNFEKAIDFTYISINVNDSLGSLDGQANCYINLSSVYQNNNQFDKSIKMISNAMAFYKKSNNILGIAKAYNAFGNSYEKSGELVKSLEAYQEFYKIRKNYSDVYLVIPLYNIGSILLLQRKPIESIPYFQKSLGICKDQNILGMKIRNLLGMAGANFQLNKLGIARQFLEEAEPLVRKTKYQDMKRDTYKLMAEVYAAIGQFDLAYETHVKHKAIEDSIFNKESDQRFATLEVKYESNKKEQENILLKNDVALKAADIKEQNQIIIAIIIILIFGLIGVFYVIRNNRLLNRKNKEIDQQKTLLEERNDKVETLFREIHHRVKNNLQIISGLLDVQADSNKSEESTQLLDDSKSRLSTMSLIHQNLYENEDVTSIFFYDYVDQLYEQIRSLYSKVAEVEFDLNIEDIEFDIDTAIPLGLILNELLTNAFKYAFNNNEYAALSITLTNDDEGDFELIVADNGKSLPKPLEELTGTGFGLKLASRLSQQLHGQLSHTYKEGNHFSINFKDLKSRLAVA